MIRKAVIDDVTAIHSIIEEFAKRGVMLYRPASDICERIRAFKVYEEGGVILGICALHVCGADMGEIRSLAVKEGSTRRGIGTMLVKACIDEARSLKLSKVFALTYKTAFFRKLGFSVIEKEVLPHKIWSDCVKCEKFPICDETAVIIDL